MMEITPSCTADQPPLVATLSNRQVWSAVSSLSLCAAMLIAAEFMPVSLLSPIATDLQSSNGMTGQAIAVSGLFAVPTSLFITSVAGRLDRRHILMGLTAIMLASLVLTACAGSFAMLMISRVLLGITIGGFWALATATVMRLVPVEKVPTALGVLYMGNAIASAFAAPLGSYLGAVTGWRGAFWALTPVVVISLVWQWVSLPSLPAQSATPVGKVLGLLKRRHVAFAMLAAMLTFAGAFSVFTYLRPFLEAYAHVNATQLSLLLLALGVAGFAGTYAAGVLVQQRLYALLMGLPLALAAFTIGLPVTGHVLWGVAAMMFAWGLVNSAIPVAWSAWLARGVSDEPESGGGLLVGCIQMSIMAGAGLGGLLLDHVSILATFTGGMALLLLAAITVGGGSRVTPPAESEAAGPATERGPESHLPGPDSSAFAPQITCGHNLC